MKKTLIAIVLGLTTGLAFANTDYTIETKKFSASHVKEGESFVAQVAYTKAVNKGLRAGFDFCSDQYVYQAYRTITGKWKAISEVECYRKVYSNNK